ncbi:hypothetical protein C5167_012845 [Papaver somniferum]|uniref:FACT complex subunit n=1 Tax=Papaver somniferum TaxID=3469 RepID=A0A4Y7IZF9_PAPSO|nr:hypothetical protein C5167_012845 [Papaver somniferum]
MLHSSKKKNAKFPTFPPSKLLFSIPPPASGSNPSFGFIRFFFWNSSEILRAVLLGSKLVAVTVMLVFKHNLLPMEVCQYTEETLEAAIRKFEGFGKTLVFKPSRGMVATKNTKDLYFEEMERYMQARLASEVKIGTSYRLLRGYPGMKDVFNKNGDAVRPSTSVKLQLETNVQDIIKLTNVTICPKVGGQGGKIIMGTLEAHVNGFRYKTSGAHTNIDVVYENIKCPFFRAGDDEIPPLLHLHLHNQIMSGTEETNDTNFQLESSTVVQTDDRNKDLQDFVDKVTDDRNCCTSLQLSIILNHQSTNFMVFFPTGARAVFALTLFFLVELVETNPIVVKLDEIEIVNLAQLRPNEIDMTVVFKDFSRDVLQINSIPLELLADIKHRLTCSNVKYYQNKQKLNWNDEVKKV